MKKILAALAALGTLAAAAAFLPALPAGAHAGHAKLGISASPSDEVALGGTVLVTVTVTDHGTDAPYTTGTVSLVAKQGGPNYEEFDSGTPDATGKFIGSLHVTEANGFQLTEDSDLINVRAHYDPENGDDTERSAVLNIAVVETACSDGLVHISEPHITGQGAPAPGTADSWSFSIGVKNCTGENLTNVKVQGGTSGWTTLGGPIVVTAGSHTVKTNKNNSVITWTLDLADGAEESITVPVSGTVGTICGAEQFLSGNWSAAYRLNNTNVKTNYTGKATIEVTCEE